jgi:uncharacterized phiE125 gp8 family phage protein
MALATLDQLRLFLGDWESSEADLLQFLLDASSDEIERTCGRTFASGDYTETYPWDPRGLIVLRQIPVISVASVKRLFTDYDGTVTLTDVQQYQLDERGWIYVVDRTINDADSVVVAYTAGFSPIPNDVVSAVCELAAIRYKSKDRLGVMSRSDPSGTTTSYAILSQPMTVRSVIERYRRWVA